MMQRSTSSSDERGEEASLEPLSAAAGVITTAGVEDIFGVVVAGLAP